MTLIATLLAATRQARFPRRAGTLVQEVVAIGRAWSNRSEVNRLLELDDRMLKDIGLARSDVVGALAVSLADDPSSVLRVRSLERVHRKPARASLPPRLRTAGRSL